MYKKGKFDEQEDINNNKTIMLQKKVHALEILNIVLVVLCITLLILWMINQPQKVQLKDGQQQKPMVTKEVIEYLKERISKSDYESANLMFMQIMKACSYDNNGELYETYKYLLNSIIEDNNIGFVFKFLNESEILITEIMIENPPESFLSFHRFRNLLKQTRLDYLKIVYQKIQKLYEQGAVEEANLILKNYAHYFGDLDLILKILMLLEKNMSAYAESEELSLNLAYDILEVAISLRDNFKMNNIIKSTEDIDLHINKLNELVGQIEEKVVRKFVNEFSKQMENQKYMLINNTTDQDIFVTAQIVLDQANQLARNPLLDTGVKKEIYRKVYDFQNHIQLSQLKVQQNKLKQYNTWALDILKRYDSDLRKILNEFLRGYDSKLKEILIYAAEIGQIDTNYLLPEIKVYYDFVLSEIIKNIKAEDIQKFVKIMFEQIKESP